MSLSLLKADLHGRIGKNLMPSRWPIESLILWCREVAKHNDGILDREADDELFNLMNSVIEMLLAHDDDRLNYFRKSRASMFEDLAEELDGIVRKELVSRIIGYDIDRKARSDLFRDHFPENLEVVSPPAGLNQSSSTAVHAGPTQ